MSKFLSQGAGDFLALKSPDLAERLTGVFTRAGVTDVGSLTIRTEDILLESGCTQPDLDSIKEHLGYFDVRLALGRNIVFPGRPLK
jgi:hypothetical protein